MTLSVLETSLPMQRSHDTLSFWHFSQKLVSWSITVQAVTHPWKNVQGPLRSKYDASTLRCEPSGATSPQGTLSSQANLPFSYSAMRDNFALGHSVYRSYTPSQWNLHVASLWHHKWSSSLKQHVYTCARCMALSVLETSLPMQRSHDTLSFWNFIQKLVSWSITAQAVACVTGLI